MAFKADLINLKLDNFRIKGASCQRTQYASKNTIGGGGRNQSVKITLPKDKNPGCRQEAC